ncbi:hypothetical protein VNO77_13847 [Canavalia gladiata]|uniref:Uncharacterized protein n=1 Tax=Canavalia gladiata TaxID=3824 RepID=A0AAN9QQI0_CANGL
MWVSSSSFLDLLDKVMQRLRVVGRYVLSQCDDTSETTLVFKCGRRLEETCQLCGNHKERMDDIRRDVENLRLYWLKVLEDITDGRSVDVTVLWSHVVGNLACGDDEEKTVTEKQRNVKRGTEDERCGSAVSVAAVDLGNWKSLGLVTSSWLCGLPLIGIMVAWVCSFWTVGDELRVIDCDSVLLISYCY